MRTLCTFLVLIQGLPFELATSLALPVLWAGEKAGLEALPSPWHSIGMPPRSKSCSQKGPVPRETPPSPCTSVLGTSAGARIDAHRRDVQGWQQHAGIRGTSAPARFRCCRGAGDTSPGSGPAARLFRGNFPVSILGSRPLCRGCEWLPFNLALFIISKA